MRTASSPADGSAFHEVGCTLLKKTVCFLVSGHSRAPAWTEPVYSSDGDTDRGASLGGGEPTPWSENPARPGEPRDFPASIVVAQDEPWQSRPATRRSPLRTAAL